MFRSLGTFPESGEGEQVECEAVSARLRGLHCRFTRFTLAIARADQFQCTERASAQSRRSGYVAAGATAKYQGTVMILITLTACPADCSIGLDAASLFQNSERSASTLVLFKTLPR